MKHFGAETFRGDAALESQKAPPEHDPTKRNKDANHAPSGGTPIADIEPIQPGQIGSRDPSI